MRQILVVDVCLSHKKTFVAAFIIILINVAKEFQALLRKFITNGLCVGVRVYFDV